VRAASVNCNGACWCCSGCNGDEKGKKIYHVTLRHPQWRPIILLGICYVLDGWINSELLVQTAVQGAMFYTCGHVYWCLWMFNLKISIEMSFPRERQVYRSWGCPVSLWVLHWKLNGRRNAGGVEGGVQTEETHFKHLISWNMEEQNIAVAWNYLCAFSSFY
jgi:hypothetical protein